MKPFQIFLSLAPFLLFGCSTAKVNLKLAHPKTLTVCTYDAFIPVSYGSGMGFEADLLRDLALRLNLRIHFIPVGNYVDLWKLPIGDEAQCDLAAGGLSAVPERLTGRVTFTSPHARIEQSLLVLAKRHHEGLREYSDFIEGMHIIGVVPGTTGKSFAILRINELGKNPKKIIKNYASEQELLEALLQGKIHAIARGNPGNIYQAKKDPRLKVTALRNFGEKFGFAVDRRNHSLINQINKILPEILQTPDNQGLPRNDLNRWIQDPKNKF